MIKKGIVFLSVILFSIAVAGQDTTKAIHSLGIYLGGNAGCLDIGAFYSYIPKLKNQPLSFDVGYAFRQSSGIEGGGRIRMFSIKKRYELLAAVHYVYHLKGTIHLSGSDEYDYSYTTTEAHNFYYFFSNRIWLEKDRMGMAAFQLDIGYSQALNKPTVGHSSYIPDDRYNEAVKATKNGLIVNVGFVIFFDRGIFVGEKFQQRH